MSISKIVIIGSFSLFSLIGVLSLFKNKDKKTVNKLQEIVIEKKIPELVELKEQKIVENDTPEVDRIDSLFVLDSSKLPIVESVTYTSRVPWLMGRHAWIADYASHYKTTRHFVARSLNKKVDYWTQKVSPGDMFNVLKADVSFYIVIDTSRLKLWFYALDNKKNLRYLLKTYKVGLGRKDSKKPSNCLTPTGKFVLGDKVAIYKPGVVGYFQDRQIEMMRVFGTRWIPFKRGIEDCSNYAKGYGIHGAPWINENDNLVEDRSKVGIYDSDGCIRLYVEDMEEIFAITISRKTVVELVDDFNKADIPLKEAVYE